jgi:hypothetical protein
MSRIFSPTERLERFNEKMRAMNKKPSAAATAEAQHADASGAATSNETPWPSPEPINSEMLPVQPLLEEMLPDPFRHWLADISHRMQCPIDFVATAAVVMTSIIIGAGCGIRPKRQDDWMVIPNLWGGVIGRPSMLKTPALTEALKPMVRLEALAKGEYDSAASEHQAEVEMHEAEKKALKSKMLSMAQGIAQKKKPSSNDAESAEDLKRRYATLESPSAPVWRRFKTNDATVERLSELMAENPRGLMIFRDELIGLLSSWDREGRESDRAFHLEAWNGYGSSTSDRITRGTTYTENQCEAIFGGIQPSKLISYLYKTVRNIENDGLIQRLQLLVYPNEPKEWKLVDQYPNLLEKNRAFAVIETLAAMDFVEHGATLDEGEKIPYFRFAADAQEFFYKWWSALEERLRNNTDDPIMGEHLGKYRSLLPSLALIFHLIEVADKKATGAVTLHSAERAALWCEYLETHAKRIYGLVGDITTQAASRIASKIESGAIEDGFTARDIYRKEWSLLDDKEITQAALQELVEAGWIKQEPARPPQAGRPSLPVYRIHPTKRREPFAEIKTPRERTDETD